MTQYLDKTGLTTLWNKIKNTFALKSHTHTKSQIKDFPTIPTVNNPTITINQGGTKKGSFTLNQSGATTINLTDNNTTYSAGTGLSLSNGAFSVKTGYTNNGKNYKVTTDSNGNLYVNVPWANDTWRPVVDNLTSTATDQSLSANQGKVLKSYIDTYFAPAKVGSNSPYSNVSTSFIGGVSGGPRINDWEFLYRAEHRNGAGDGPNYIMEMVSDLTSNSSIYWRKKTGSSFSSFREIIDSNNIGSQSVKYATTSHLLRTYNASGGSHGEDYYLQCRHNVNGNGRFKLQIIRTNGNVTHSTSVDHAITADTAGSANSVAWGNVSGKPSTFTPASHTHTKSQITDFPTKLPASNISMSFSNGVLTITYN